MGNMERAPEPTMEEILASIRRIIADDDQGAPRAAPNAAPEANERESDSAETEADSQIIDDIARVLSGGQGGGEEDEVLDLTRELGLTPLPDESDLRTMDEPTLQLDEPALEMMTDAEFEVDGPQPAPEPEPDFTLETVLPEPKLEAVPEPRSMADEATSALEQAIAALRAGRLGSAEPAPAPFVPEPEPEPEAEPELVLTEFAAIELVMEDPAERDTQLAADDGDMGEESSWSSDLADLQGESEDEAPIDFIAARMSGTANGGASYETSYAAPEPSYAAAESPYASSKTLEDSVKEMLRPMLRQWLDENMSRVLTAALREELEQGRVGRHDA